jgi:hypothetical protein
LDLYDAADGAKVYGAAPEGQALLVELADNAILRSR